MPGQLGPHRNSPAGTGVLYGDDRDALPGGGMALRKRKRHARATPRHVPRSAYGVMRCLVHGVTRDPRVVIDARTTSGSHNQVGRPNRTTQAAARRRTGLKQHNGM
ncbi:hypothetical protein GCM10010211_68860 [Streptomyces albospinus]|uniref:Uncharacterized protein n=1 Tax=Streptomyces albospinus TaxID=285515 RepID=A0ABQ2VJT4_9ACTN|nr:hypothetical protein GCM10010211_68860 [Streptomyces albospinus]